MPTSRDTDNSPQNRRGGGGRIDDRVGSNLGSEAHANLIRKMLTKLQGHAPTDEEIEEEMGPSAGSSPRLGGSGSYPGSIAPLQTMAHFNPGNKLIEALLQIAVTRRNEGGA